MISNLRSKTVVVTVKRIAVEINEQNQHRRQIYNLRVRRQTEFRVGREKRQA